MTLNINRFAAICGKFVKTNGATFNIADAMSAQAGKNASDTITRPDNTTPYSINDVVSTAAGEILTFANISNEAGSEVFINSVNMMLAVAAIPAGMGNFRLHLYNAAPTAIADNAAYNLPAADRAKYLGYITIPTPVDLGETLWSQYDNINKRVKLAADSTTLYGILQTTAAYTPTASTVKTISLSSLGVQL